jgi:hypothetical protein
LAVPHAPEPDLSLSKGSRFLLALTCSQALLFSPLLFYWIRHPDKRWLDWLLGGVYSVRVLPTAHWLARSQQIALSTFSHHPTATVAEKHFQGTIGRLKADGCALS